MKRLCHFSLVFLMALGTVAAVAQTPRRRTNRRPPAKIAPPQPSLERGSQPQPSPATASRPLPPPAPIPLAIVNGQTITTADIDRGAMEEVRAIEESIAAAPGQILETQINTELLNVEARKRKLTSQQLHDLEVTKRIANPTETEIQTFIETNRAQLDTTDPATLRTEVVSWLRAKKEETLTEDLVRRLRAANPVVMGVDINTPNLTPSAVVATVAGKSITAGTISERLKPVVYKLRLNVYEIQKAAVDRTINDLLLIAEANKRNIAPEEIVRLEISQKVKTPTETDVAKFYSDNKARINGDLNSVRHQIAKYLLEQERQRLEKTLSERLRKSSDVRILISEPQRPVQLISTDDDPSRGEINAPVTVVEFTDFQCPACAAMHPILEEVLKAYEKKVRFVVRDFPLNQHANARKAAEAANAAHAQGKFFEYARLLFQRQKALDVLSLKKYATELGLDRKRFDAELDAGTYAAEVKHDIADGEMYGIDSTPTIFVNGLVQRNLSAEGLRTAIDQALSSATTQKTTNN